MTSRHCLAFWRHSWPCWGDFWCCCLLRRHAWQCYWGRWILQLLEDLLRLLWQARGLEHSASSLLSSSGWSSGLLVVQTIMLRRVVLSCMCWWVCETSARSLAKSRSSRVEKRVPVVGPMLFAASPSQEQRWCKASLSNTSLHTEAGFAVSHSALDVVVEALDDEDDLLWNSICPEYVL